jgi:hypothetical protein
MKTCPECGSHKVITFDSDNNLCQKCRNWFPSIAEEKCKAGCRVFTGGEIRHHKDCVYYTESLSKILDDTEDELKKLKKSAGVKGQKESALDGKLIGKLADEVWSVYKKLNFLTLTTAGAKSDVLAMADKLRKQADYLVLADKLKQISSKLHDIRREQ